jgi:hypothetical protein
MGTPNVPSAPSSMAAAAAGGEEGAEAQVEANVPSTPAIDPAFVLDTSVSNTAANTFVGSAQQADDNPFGASKMMSADSENPFGQPVIAPSAVSSSSTVPSQNPFGTSKVEE